MRCSSLLAFPTIFRACSSYMRMDRRKGRMASRSVRLPRVQKNLQGLGALISLKKRINVSHESYDCEILMCIEFLVKSGE